ncbi:DUF5342 family protein [Lederbergia lenta]|uniref:YheE family protein n=1 Tax=Lederbergia lenta TaxID=1467 RepID=A0A2X4W8S9_LEDLE|nr:DUF5342 family protein [Lederbergia lenta]MCM3110532.1 YheE family protein [Lederbergia lenta]MEC2323902.1 DUF5342 family protein [Lederbergia lenta]SQI61057.1 Uncharacterised protein [Lederbergia lenta]
MQHFQVQSLYADKRLPGWTFSFYLNQHKYTGIYHSNGNIEWTINQPDDEHINKIQTQIHDLMIYHIYDEQR